VNIEDNTASFNGGLQERDKDSPSKDICSSKGRLSALEEIHFFLGTVL
jgi:hypothetical protein